MIKDVDSIVASRVVYERQKSLEIYIRAPLVVVATFACLFRPSLLFHPPPQTSGHRKKNEKRFRV